MTWAVNVAAPFLLTGCLLDVVAERVVNVSSISAASSLDFDNLQQVPLPPCTVQLYSCTAVQCIALLPGCLAVQPYSCTNPACREHCQQLSSKRPPGTQACNTLSSPFDPPCRQERGFSAHGAYSLSKLADMMLTFEMADRLQAAGSGVTVNCLDPGGGACRDVVTCGRWPRALALLLAGSTTCAASAPVLGSAWYFLPCRCC
jgi:NAD(P)-dependent dehydrogenase (short-subunit alcohol dehydrogenase family)